MPHGASLSGEAARSIPRFFLPSPLNVSPPPSPPSDYVVLISDPLRRDPVSAESCMSESPGAPPAAAQEEAIPASPDVEVGESHPPPPTQGSFNEWDRAFWDRPFDPAGGLESGLDMPGESSWES